MFKSHSLSTMGREDERDIGEIRKYHVSPTQPIEQMKKNFGFRHSYTHFQHNGGCTKRDKREAEQHKKRSQAINKDNLSPDLLFLIYFSFIRYFDSTPLLLFPSGIISHKVFQFNGSFLIWQLVLSGSTLTFKYPTGLLTKWASSVVRSNSESNSILFPTTRSCSLLTFIHKLYFLLSFILHSTSLSLASHSSTWFVACFLSFTTRQSFSNLGTSSNRTIFIIGTRQISLSKRQLSYFL